MSALAIAAIELPMHARAAAPWLDGADRTTELLIGAAKLRAYIPAIQELRRQAGQEDDMTSDPHYFMAANALSTRRIMTVLIRRNRELEACVFFFEHCRFGIGLGFCRGGDGIGEGLVAGGPAAFRIHYVHLATQALLRHWRIHGVSLAIMAPVNHCLEVMGPADACHCFAGRSVARNLPLPATYRAMLESMGPRTRRSLAGKRRKLEKSLQIAFTPWLRPEQAQEAMLSLQPKARPQREPGFYQARFALLRDRPDFFCMGLQLPDGAWLSLVSGWRRGDTTYVDLQLNHSDYKKHSLSAVMRAYLLEYEISFHRQCIHFVGGTSLLLRRYCTPAEPSTYALFVRPGLRTDLFRMIVPYIKKDSVYERFGRQPRGNDAPDCQPWSPPLMR